MLVFSYFHIIQYELQLRDMEHSPHLYWPLFAEDGEWKTQIFIPTNFFLAL